MAKVAKAEAKPGFLVSDNPIENQISEKDDIFQFEAFVQTFKSIVINKKNNTPFTIAIDGKWGSGKTTLMKLTREALDMEWKALEGKSQLVVEGDKKKHLEKYRYCKTFWFNAWKYSSEEHILSALLLEMFRELEKDQTFWDEVKTKINFKQVYTGILNSVVSKASSKDVGDYFNDIRASRKASFLDEFTEVMRGLIKNFCEVRGKEAGLGKEAGKTADKDASGVFAIFIDDLDRCAPDKVLQVIEAVKLFLDEPGCVFFMGMESDRIKDAISSQYKDKIEVDPTRYLEKIFQIHVRLPPTAPANMDALFDFYAKEIINLEEADNKELKKVFVAANFTTQRALKRALNDYLFMDSLLSRMKNVEK